MTTAECAKACGTPMDPLLATQGWAMHPACEYPPPPWTRGERAASRRAAGLVKPKARRKPKAKAPEPPAPEVVPEAPQPELPPQRPSEDSRLGKVLATVAAAGVHGLCPAQCREVFPDGGSVQVAPLLWELTRQRLLVKAPKARDTPYGPQQVYVAREHVPAGAQL